MLGHLKEQAEAYITQSKVSSGNTPTLSSSYHCDWPADPDAQTFLPSTHHTPPSTVPPGDASAAPNGYSYPEPSYQEHNLQSNGSEFQEASQVNTSQQTPGREIDLAPFSVHGPMNFDPSNFDFCPQHGFGIEKRVNEETGAAILEPVTNFSLAIFRNQAEASVMASVVADYIAWLCKTPPGGGIALSEQPVYLGMLGTLEVRLRELCEVSQSRSNAALRELVASLEALAPPHGPMATRLGSLEEDLQREARERTEAFRSRYNPCALLSEQSRNTSP